MLYWKKNALPKNKKEIQPQQAISFSSCLTFAANHTIPIPPKRSPTPTKNVKIRLPSPSPKKVTKQQKMVVETFAANRWQVFSASITSPWASWATALKCSWAALPPPLRKSNAAFPSGGRCWLVVYHLGGKNTLGLCKMAWAWSCFKTLESLKAKHFCLMDGWNSGSIWSNPPVCFQVPTRWWFRNHIPNHRLDGAKTLVNNGN